MGPEKLHQWEAGEGQGCVRQEVLVAAFFPPFLLTRVLE